jgi:hypothetical protein
MIPVFVSWTHFTATAAGRAVKFVTCESCATEYVYVLEREASGGGTTAYGLNSEGAERDAKSAAGETLAAVLENDFDPVPCPACGHYQKYMFPKLMETKGAAGIVLAAVALMGGCLAAVGALYWTANYFQGPNEYHYRRMVTTWSILAVVCLVLLGQSLVRKYRIRYFDPNREDQQARLAKARSRAITRAEFEKLKKSEADSGGGA